MNPSERGKPTVKKGGCRDGDRGTRGGKKAQ